MFGLLPRKILIVLMTIIGVISCGGGGIEDGIGGTGVRATGPITAFGSIFVNGIEFETGSATIRVDDQAANESDLELGMIVTVRGIRNDAGVYTADDIDYDDDIEGPIVDVPQADPDGLTKSFTVIATTVVVESGVTVFDSEDNFDSAFGFETIAQGDIVEVSGQVNDTGALIATRVEKQQDSGGDPAVELKGVIANLADGGDTFDLGDVNVQFDPDGIMTNLSEIPLGVRNGAFVEIHGELIAEAMVFATKIQEEDNDDFDDADEQDEIELEGFVSDFADLSNFRVSGQLVDASGNVDFKPDSLRDTLGDGNKVEVKGHIINGILVADEVQSEDEQLEVSAFVGSVDVVMETITLTITPTETLTIGVRNDTQFSDEQDELENFALVDINAGDFLKVKVTQGSGDPVASHVEREPLEDAERVRVEGPLDGLDEAGQTVTVFGITFGFNNETDFEVNDVDLTREQFLDLVQVGDIVSVKDIIVGGNTDGLADEIEIEIED